MPWKRWNGGRYWESKTGRKTYYIVRKVAGRSYQINTRCHDERSATVHLLRFEAEPTSYSALAVKRSPVRLTDELIDEYIQHGLAEKENTKQWSYQVRCILNWWKDQLPADIRGVPVERLRATMRGTPNVIGKTKHLRAFYAWLRQTERIRFEDDNARLLKAPQQRPEQLTRPKWVPKDKLKSILTYLDDPYRSAVKLLFATGMHAVELGRVLKSGSVEERDGQYILTIPRTKRGDSHRVIVSKQIAGLARVLIEVHYDMSIKYLDILVRRACNEAGFVAFGLGQARHSFAHYAIEAGSPPAAIAAALHHRSFATTKRFYSTLAAPPKVATMF